MAAKIDYLHKKDFNLARSAALLKWFHSCGLLHDFDFVGVECLKADLGKFLRWNVSTLESNKIDRADRFALLFYIHKYSLISYYLPFYPPRLPNDLGCSVYRPRPIHSNYTQRGKTQHNPVLLTYDTNNLNYSNDNDCNFLLRSITIDCWEVDYPF